MTITQLEKLLDAGFSKDDIIALVKEEPASPAEPLQTEPEQKPPEQEEQETIEKPIVADNTQEDDKLNKRLDGIEKSIGDIIKTFQNANLRNDSIRNMPDSLEEQTDKIMAAIIRPEPERGERK